MSDSGWWNSGWNPSNWFSGSGASSGNTPTMMGADFSSMADAGYQVPSSAQMSNANNFTQSADTSGGMNWAGLSSGLSNLSKQLGGSGSSDSTNVMQGSKSVANTGASGGSLAPAGGGSGASALASMLNQREQLAQYLMLAAMQGKGRSKGGGGLLG